MMSIYVKNLNSKYLLAASALLLTACVVAAGAWYIPESAAGQSESASAAPTGFEVPGPIKGAPRICEADYPYYTSLGQMKKTADVIMKGTVLSTEQRDINISLAADRDDNPSFDSYWVSSVRVDKVVKGDLHEGDVIEVKQLLSGDPIGMGTKDSHGVMFLVVYPDNIPAEPVNPYQGVVPVTEGIARPSFADNAMPRGLKEDAFIARVQSAN